MSQRIAEYQWRGITDDITQLLCMLVHTTQLSTAPKTSYRTRAADNRVAWAARKRELPIEELVTSSS